jgi:hypothetical protein
MSELSNKLAGINLDMTARHIELVIPSNPSDWAHDRWEITISYEGRSLSTEYKTGLGHRALARGTNKTFKGLVAMYYGKRVDGTATANMNVEQAAMAGLIVPVKPDLVDVMHSLLMDAGGASETFENWCANFGYDSDSRRALNTYLECQKISDSMNKVLGQKMVQDLCGLEH